MMRQMGWREGQGVGPKIKRKLRKLKSKLKNSKLALFLKSILILIYDIKEPEKKIYGVALPSESDESMGEVSTV